jgi:A/G-specific adenine glycosylase
MTPTDFIPPLLAWFNSTAADLPWRASPDPYRVWLSEVMLQQTQITTVIPYYHQFLAAYPSVHDLAAADLDAVLKLWEGLGYYSRARHLHRAAQVVSRDMGGVFPATAEGLRALPGVGPYTAGAIASIAYGERAPVLDGNVIRVFSRLFDLSEDVSLPRTQQKLWAMAAELVPEDSPGDYNQALMELGQKVCKPRSPLCSACPVQAHCAAHRAGTQAERPVKRKKAPTPHYQVTAGLIRDDVGRLLIAKRPEDKLLGGLWEFPGGKFEAAQDADLPACLRRELREELAIEVEVGEFFAQVDHAFTHFKITLHAFECRYLAEGGPPQAIACTAWRWVAEEELAQYAFGKADRAIIERLKQRRGMLF